MNLDDIPPEIQFAIWGQLEWERERKVTMALSITAIVAAALTAVALVANVVVLAVALFL